MATFRSSIFNFDTLATTRLPVPAAALLAVLIVAFCELGLHLCADDLPDAVVWGTGEVSTKIAQVQQRGTSADTLDVLIVGPSHASVGVSPAEIIKASPQEDLSAYNGALNGRDYPVLAFVLKNAYLPSLRPKTLVVSVSPISFNRNCALLALNTEEFFEAPMPKALTSYGLAGWWRRFLAEDVYLFRYRRRERGLLEGYVDGEKVLDDLGYHALNGLFDDKARARLASPRHRYHLVWPNYEFGGPSLDSLEHILQLATRWGMRVVVVNMPFRPELLEMAPVGQEAYQTYLSGMERLRDQNSFGWLDYQAELEFDDGDFHDVDHLNRRGASKLSIRLARDLALTP